VIAMQLIASLGALSSPNHPVQGMADLVPQRKTPEISLGDPDLERAATQVITLLDRAKAPMQPRALHQAIPSMPRMRLKHLLLRMVREGLLAAAGGTHTRRYTTPERAGELAGNE
jgi:hypothetical protein